MPRSVDPEAAKRLASDVLYRAVMDWKHVRTKKLERFFNSKWFDYWCALAMIDADAAREALDVPRIVQKGDKR